jgi:hypothetical protein
MGNEILEIRMEISNIKTKGQTSNKGKTTNKGQTPNKSRFIKKEGYPIIKYKRSARVHKDNMGEHKKEEEYYSQASHIREGPCRHY